MIRADLGIARVYATGEGLLVMSVVDDGPAERAGVQPVRMRVEQMRRDTFAGASTRTPPT